MLEKVEYCCPCTSALDKNMGKLEPPLDTPDNHKASAFWYGAILFYYFACAFSLALTHGYWGNVLFFPLIFSYTLLLVLIWKRLRRRGYYDDSKIHLNDLVRCYCHAFFGTAHFVLWIQLLFSLYISYRFKLNTDSVGYETYFIFFSIFLQGIIEEYIGKGVVLQHSTQIYLPYERYLNESYVHTYAWFGLCIGLGMSTMVDGVAAVCIIGYLYGGWKNQLITFVVCSLIGIPLQGLLGVLWGINWCEQVTKQHHNKYNRSIQKSKHSNQPRFHEDGSDQFGNDSNNGFCHKVFVWFKLGWKQATLLSVYYIIQNQYLLLDSIENKKKVLVWMGISVLFFLLLFLYVYRKFNAILVRQQLLAVNDDDIED